VQVLKQVNEAVKNGAPLLTRPWGPLRATTFCTPHDTTALQCLGGCGAEPTDCTEAGELKRPKTILGMSSVTSCNRQVSPVDRVGRALDRSGRMLDVLSSKGLHVVFVLHS
jgi:hypothetical protein